MTRREKYKFKFRLAIFLLLFMLATGNGITSVVAAGGSTAIGTSTGGSTSPAGGSIGILRRRYVGAPVRGTSSLLVFALYSCGLVTLVSLIQWGFTRSRD